MSFDTPGAVGEPRRSTNKGRAIAIAVGTTVVAFLFSLVASIAFLIPLFLLEFDVQSFSIFLGLFVVGQLGFAAVGYAIARVRGMRITTVVPDLREVSIAIGGAVAALVLAIVLSLVIGFFGLTPDAVLDDVGIENPSLFLWIAFLSIVLVAPAEEFLFRGVVQGTLREAFGPVAAVAGASLLFGSLHLANYTGRPETVVAGAAVIVGTGAVLGALYELTDNLAVPIAAHALYNVVLSTIAFLSL